jgi:hypothetical protein
MINRGLNWLCVRRVARRRFLTRTLGTGSISASHLLFFLSFLLIELLNLTLISLSLSPFFADLPSTSGPLPVFFALPSLVIRVCPRVQQYLVSLSKSIFQFVRLVYQLRFLSHPLPIVCESLASQSSLFPNPPSLFLLVFFCSTNKNKKTFLYHFSLLAFFRSLQSALDFLL